MCFHPKGRWSRYFPVQVLLSFLPLITHVFSVLLHLDSYVQGSFILIQQVLSLLIQTPRSTDSGVFVFLCWFPWHHTGLICFPSISNLPLLLFYLQGPSFISLWMLISSNTTAPTSFCFLYKTHSWLSSFNPNIEWNAHYKTPEFITSSLNSIGKSVI